MNAGKGPASIRTALTTDPHSVQNQALWAACCMGFFGFLGCSEFVAPDSSLFDSQVHLCVADLVCVHNETHNHIEVQIKASTTDQYR